MKILLTGGSGQLGSEIKKIIPKNILLFCPTRKELDLSDNNSIKKIVSEFKPDWIINCGAYTNVDKAEYEIELAYQINASALKTLAESLSTSNGKILHISTDYVFNGENFRPYKTSDQRCPIGIYGKSKSKGEEFLEDLLKTRNKGIILRTSWVIGSYGNNFALKMIDLHNKKDYISVVSDQIGCPTSANKLAKVCWEIIYKSEEIDFKNNVGIMHWSDSGAASWYDVAIAVGEIGKDLGLIKNKAQVIPVKSEDYKSSAKRPYYSLLDCSLTRKIIDKTSLHWQKELEETLKSFRSVN